MLRIELKKYRELKGLSQQALADIIGVRQSTIGMWESGKNHPEYANLQKLATALDIPISALTESDRTTPNKKGVRIPVLGRIPAGVPIEAIEDFEDFEEIPIDWTTDGREYFALRISGNSMYPKYIDKDIVIFEKVSTCDSGAECAVIVNGYDAVFKKVIRYDAGIALQPLNTTDYEPVFYTNEQIVSLPVNVIGVAREIRRSV